VKTLESKEIKAQRNETVTHNSVFVAAHRQMPDDDCKIDIRHFRCLIGVVILIRFDINQNKDTISTPKTITGDQHMTAKALFVRLEAKPGKENEVAKFLRDGQGLVQQEPATTAWFAIKLGPTTFAIFDAFPDDAGRDAHLSGKVAKALMEKAPDLLAQPPKIEKADVLADRLPG
jgi:quinol monooxygenase YgiN